ncbi:hypothetical protein KY290_036120 [Solanum tuberosum]|uniref:Integrase core domain containing protein n=1 Tax=Solanum tuberosum TaxID=4113 RepID=A0ABQ7TSE4_SOLTU|nr:hypothetical protein KY289_035645 [Solanum tuberosum]KAH0638819.1 hypothetical protein KY285_035405 [Solanum tuberosum]KAH0737415.1 hypothetical protein KY290_036120 [Solanum tuberosum]
MPSGSPTLQRVDHVVPPIIDPVNQHVPEVVLEDPIPSTLIQDTNAPEVRRLVRGSRPPIWHKNYVVKAGSSSF